MEEDFLCVGVYTIWQNTLLVVSRDDAEKNTRLKTKRTRRRRRKRRPRDDDDDDGPPICIYIHIYIYIFLLSNLFLCFFSSSRGAVLFKLVPETSFPGKRIFYGPTVRRRVADGGG